MANNNDTRPRLHLHGLVPGLILLGIGVFFLLRNLGIHLPLMHNWWAWAILVVALLPLSRAIHARRSRGRWDATALRDLLNAGILVLIAMVFLLHLSWAIWWPLFMIYTGLYLLAQRLGRGP